jgi:hypothetical protein
LVSASIDHFDPWLLTQATSEWQAVRRAVARAMILNSEPFFQISDVMLRSRVVALVDEGKLPEDSDRGMGAAAFGFPANGSLRVDSSG